MAEPTVQVPVSLLEDALRSLDLDAAHPDTVKELWALLSQPTAEPCARCGHGMDVHSEHGGMGEGCQLCMCHAFQHDATPPSIADMVPGTTFTAAFSEAVWRWAVREDGLIVSGLGVGRMSAIDPSTIRDVTPPAVTL